MSVISFPNRGPWGDKRYRGNCSGYVYKFLFEQLRPRVFVDPCAGSATSVEVAQELGIEAYGLDLRTGFNLLRDSILETIGKPADLCFSHPPYADMIVYSGCVWGGQPHPDDLSRCLDDDDFVDKLHQGLLNQRHATANSGYYGLLIGDLRRRGRYRSYQADMIARLPQSELRAVMIKQQHHCTSDVRHYRLQLPRILHEYIVLWQKTAAPVSLIYILRESAQQQQRHLQGTWKAVVHAALVELGGAASLPTLYAHLSDRHAEKRGNNPHWHAKVRQTLQRYPAIFAQQARGRWRLAA
ncbi:MAG: hypothetical protein ACR2PS_05205 [Pseudomonadales bacterium]